MEQTRTAPHSGSIEVYALTDAERRLLLEMLVSERCGEEALDVAKFGRRDVATMLCDLRMSCFVSQGEVTFTHYGRSVAEVLALRLFNRRCGYTC